MTRSSIARRTPSLVLLASVLMCGSIQQAVAALNVSITVFDPGIPADQSTHRDLQVFPRIRQIEALFLPFVLRKTLAETNEWGAVRVVPEPNPAVELLLSGAIVNSDGTTLELKLVAVDASGHEWLNKTYTGAAPVSYEQGGEESGLSGYQKLYDEIAADLLTARTLIDSETLDDIAEISLLRYASQLAPTAFGDYLETAPDGTFRILRLPADGDPMLERIERIRGVEYVMTDAVDEEFEELHADIAFVYDLWRKYRREFKEYKTEEARRLQNARIDAPRGSYEAMLNRYENYKWDRIAAQEQEHWAMGFDNEVGPAVTELEARVAKLDGWVEQNYEDWTRLLEELFLLETGFEE
jgi:hypothetical protein